MSIAFSGPLSGNEDVALSTALSNNGSPHSESITIKIIPIFNHFFLYLHMNKCFETRYRTAVDKLVQFNVHISKKYLKK